MDKIKNQKKSSKLEKVATHFDFIYEQIREENIIINWRKKGFSVRLVNENILDGLESKEKEEFIDTVFFILKNTRSFVEGNTVKDCYIVYINKLLDTIPYLKDNLIVYKTSGSYVLEEYDYDILTKRDNEDINKIIGYSAQVSLNASHSNDSDKVKTISFDISKHDLEKLISKLMEAKEKIELLNN